MELTANISFQYSPNDITPIAWKTPPRTNREPFRSPLDSSGTCAPCVMTVIIMTSILIKARADAFASCEDVNLHVGSQRGRTCLGNVAVQRQWIRNAKNEYDYYRPPVRQKPEERRLFERREYGYHYMRYGIANDYAERNHTAKCTAVTCLSNGNLERPLYVQGPLCYLSQC